MQVKRFDDLPGLTFDVRKSGLIERAWCLRCGHGFVPTMPMNARSAWTAAQQTRHVKEGCDSTKGQSTTALAPVV
jgi:hypothetical protein